MQCCILVAICLKLTEISSIRTWHEFTFVPVLSAEKTWYTAARDHCCDFFISYHTEIFLISSHGKDHCCDFFISYHTEIFLISSQGKEHFWCCTILIINYYLKVLHTIFLLTACLTSAQMVGKCNFMRIQKELIEKSNIKCDSETLRMC